MYNTCKTCRINVCYHLTFNCLRENNELVLLPDETIGTKKATVINSGE